MRLTNARAALLPGLLPALLLVAAVQSGAQVYNAWGKYRTLTINTTATGGGANVTETATDFPVLVRLSNQSLATGANALSEALAGGADIRFTNAAGDAALSYEIERWTATGADIWVKVPSVAGNASTTIRMYWGNAAATNASSGPAVFDTTQGFTAVWHMNGAGSGGLVNENDATGGGLTATQFNSSGTNAASSDVGGVGYYRDLVSDGSTGQGFVTSNVARANFLNTQSYTISAWVKPTTVEHTPYPVIVSKHDNQWTLRANTNVAGPWLFFHGNGGNWPEAQSSEVAVNGQWTHVTGVRSQTPNSMSIYVNGVLTGNTNNPASGGTQVTTSSVAIGRMAENADRYWNGAIAEVRIENVARSAARVKLDYETQKPGATALTLGTTQSVQARALFYPTKNASYARNVVIENNVPVVTGTATSFSVAPTTLPAGLSFNTTTGVISGTPTTLGAAQQFIVTVNLQGGGTGLDTLSIAVVAGQVPGVPTGITAVAGNAQATVSWTAPAVTGSGAITGYTARAVSDTTKSCQWTTGPLSCTITGLTNGTSYTFTVRAQNGAGFGAASAVSNAVTPAAPPGAPTGVTRTQTSGGGTSPSVQVSWVVPASNGGAAISSYTATSSPAGGTCSAFGATATSCTVATGLTYGTAYTFTVTATNTAGTSAASAPSTALTPVGILPGSFTIRSEGAARPFSFVLSPEAAQSKEAFTLSIIDTWGRTVWSRTVHPAQDGTRILAWDGRNTAGQAASAGVYVVRLMNSEGKAVANFVEKTLKP
jgi:hypothetical protein